MRYIDPADGAHIPCHWADCERWGDDRYEAVVTDINQPHIEPTLGVPVPGEIRHTHYLFCGERHKAYWVNSHVSHGNLPAGSKQLHG